jgi:hypothetical protein
VAIRVLVDLYLGSGRYSFWDGHQHASLDGQTYLAAGAFSTISGISFGQDLGADGVEITFDASRLLAASTEPFDPAALLATVHDEAYHQKRVDIRFAFFDAETGALVLTVRRFGGIIDQIEIRETPGGDEGPGSAAMIIRCESVARRYGRREGRTRSHEDQTEIWPGDDFFKFTQSTVASERRLIWGRKPTAGALTLTAGTPQGTILYPDTTSISDNVRG